MANPADPTSSSPRATPIAVARRFLEKMPEGALRDATERLVARADGVMDTLARTSAIMERVAQLELGVVQKLGVVVEDLGQLVKLQLEEARRRLGKSAPERTDDQPRARGPIIDVEEAP